MVRFFMSGAGRFHTGLPLLAKLDLPYYDFLSFIYIYAFRLGLAVQPAAIEGEPCVGFIV